MAITAKWYLKGARKVATGSVDLDTDTLKLAILANTHTPDTDGDEFFADVSGDEISDGDYTAGGEALGTVTVTEDTSGDEVEFDVADPSWPGEITGAYAVVYKDTTNPATSPLLVLYNLDGDQTFDTLVIAAEGFAKIQTPTT